MLCELNLPVCYHSFSTGHGHALLSRTYNWQGQPQIGMDFSDDLPRGAGMSMIRAIASLSTEKLLQVRLENAELTPDFDNLDDDEDFIEPSREDFTEMLQLCAAAGWKVEHAEWAPPAEVEEIHFEAAEPTHDPENN